VPRAEAASAVIAPAHKVKIILAAVSFARSVQSAPGEVVGFAIVGSCEAGEAFGEAGGKKINGKTVKVVQTGAAELAAAIDAFPRGAAGLVFTCEHSRAQYKTIVSAAEKAGWMLVADDADLAKEEAVLAVGVNGERPELILNMRAAERINATFDPRIFGIAKVIK
jgi:hypothetical protein